MADDRNIHAVVSRLGRSQMSPVAIAVAGPAMLCLALGAGCGDDIDGGPCTYDTQSVTIRITAIEPAGREGCAALCGESVTVVGNVLNGDGTVLAEGLPVAEFVYQPYATAMGWTVGADVEGKYDSIRTGTCTPSIAYLGADDFDARRQSEARCASDLVDGSGASIDSCSVLDCVSPPSALTGAPCSVAGTCDPGFAENNVLYECSAGTWQAVE